MPPSPPLFRVVSLVLVSTAVSATIVLRYINKEKLAQYISTYQDVPEPLPPNIFHIVKHAPDVYARYPKGRWRSWRFSKRPFTRMARLLNLPPHDTPQACFYRIYEFMMTENNFQFRNEISYFCRQPWPICELEDPNDHDPNRVPALAALTEILCDSFNTRLDHGITRDAPAYITDFDEMRARPKVHDVPPQWALQTKPRKNQLRIGIKDDHPERSRKLAKYNIIMMAPHYHFL